MVLDVEPYSPGRPRRAGSAVETDEASEYRICDVALKSLERVGTRDDIGNSEGAGQKLNVGYHVAFSLGDDAGGRLQFGRCLG